MHRSVPEPLGPPPMPRRREGLFELRLCRGPLGVRLAPESEGEKTIVHGFERKGGQSVGEKYLQIGDELLAVNGIDVEKQEFSAVIATLKSAYWPLTLRFRRPVKSHHSDTTSETLSCGGDLNDSVSELERVSSGNLGRASHKREAELESYVSSSPSSSSSVSELASGDSLDVALARCRKRVRAHLRSDSSSTSSDSYHADFRILPKVQKSLEQLSMQIGQTLERLEHVEQRLCAVDSLEAADEDDVVDEQQKESGSQLIRPDASTGTGADDEGFV